MTTRSILPIGILTLLGAVLLFPAVGFTANNQILGWNNLGMHCMDSDYSVFSILPPYNTIEAQLIVNGALVTASNGYTVTYQAVADLDGSINKTSSGKGNWLQFAPLLYGGVAADQGLPFPDPNLSFWMPGTNNQPQGMVFDPGLDWFYAYGIPITPYDDAGQKNPYPMMRLIARNSGGTAIATNDIVLPVSDEMDCRACHISGGRDRAKPAAGWVWDLNPERDYRLNILRLHDQLQFSNHFDLYVSALAARGFNPQGLYHGVVADGKPVLCAVCHASEALGTGSYSNIPPLTASIHAQHARARDPDTLISLDSAVNRSACYRCHPGSTTRCLRGAMGGAIAADGTLEMQCQSCHGNMSQVGASSRTGWLMEPNCQSCHTGTATSNNGQIRYTSCFTDTNWTVRLAVNQTFATKSNTPAPGISLYRFSAGHGGLQCSACHGSTHAEFPATHRNDNVRNEKIQGHAGMMIECTACHVSMAVNATTAVGGPHGMHPVGQDWADKHGDLIENNPALGNSCRNCHGTNSTGTVLSRMQANRTIPTKENKYGTKNYWRGQQVSCYDCHDGPNHGDPSLNTPAIVSNVTTNTLNNVPVNIVLPASDPNGNPLTFRIVSQPAHGAAGVSNSVATYFPEPGFVGTETFTFAANDTWSDSNLGTSTVAVAQGPFSISAKAYVPPSYPAGAVAPFTVIPTPSNVVTKVTFDWNFGDGSAHSTNQYAAHAYSTPGNYTWTVVSRVQSGPTEAAVTNSAVIAIPWSVLLSATRSGNSIVLTWPAAVGSVVLEQSPALGLEAGWTLCASNVVPAGDLMTVTVSTQADANYYRLRRP